MAARFTRISLICLAMALLASAPGVAAKQQAPLAAQLKTLEQQAQQAPVGLSVSAWVRARQRAGAARPQPGASGGLGADQSLSATAPFALGAASLTLRPLRDYPPSGFLQYLKTQQAQVDLDLSPHRALRLGVQTSQGKTRKTQTSLTLGQTEGPVQVSLSRGGSATRGQARPTQNTQAMDLALRLSQGVAMWWGLSKEEAGASLAKENRAGLKIGHKQALRLEARQRERLTRKGKTVRRERQQGVQTSLTVGDGWALGADVDYHESRARTTQGGVDWKADFSTPRFHSLADLSVAVSVGGGHVGTALSGSFAPTQRQGAVSVGFATFSPRHRVNVGYAARQERWQGFWHERDRTLSSLLQSRLTRHSKLNLSYEATALQNPWRDPASAAWGASLSGELTDRLELTAGYSLKQWLPQTGAAQEEEWSLQGLWRW